MMNSKIRSISTAIVGIMVLGTGLVFGQVTEAQAFESTRGPTKAQLIAFKKFKKFKKGHHHKKVKGHKKFHHFY